MSLKRSSSGSVITFCSSLSLLAKYTGSMKPYPVGVLILPAYLTCCFLLLLFFLPKVGWSAFSWFQQLNHIDWKEGKEMFYLMTHSTQLEENCCCHFIGYSFQLAAVSFICTTPGGKEGNVWINDTLNTFYLRLYGTRHVVKDHSDS